MGRNDREVRGKWWWRRGHAQGNRDGGTGKGRGEGRGGRSGAGEQGGWKTEKQIGEMGVGQNGRQGRDRTERKRVRW